MLTMNNIFTNFMYYIFRTRNCRASPTMKKHDVGAVTILDFILCHHNYKGVTVGNDPQCIGSFLRTHFIS